MGADGIEASLAAVAILTALFTMCIAVFRYLNSTNVLHYGFISFPDCRVIPDHDLAISVPVPEGEKPHAAEFKAEAMKLRMRIYTWIVAVLFLFTWQTAGIAEEPAVTNSQAASSVINTFHAVLLSTMKHARSLGYRGRYMRLEPTIRRSYDFPKVVRVTAGKYWRDLNHDQKVQFLRIFSHLVIATYAHRFDGYSGESFQAVSTRASGHGRMVVRTVLIKRNGSRVHLDYLLRQHKGQWRIVNVIAQGVSDLALKRVEYTTVLRRQGFDALMAKLEEKIAQYE